MTLVPSSSSPGEVGCGERCRRGLGELDARGNRPGQVRGTARDLVVPAATGESEQREQDEQATMPGHLRQRGRGRGPAPKPRFR